MATLDPAGMLNATVSGDNAVQVIAALQLEVLRLNNVLNQFNQDISSQTAMNKSSLDFDISAIIGDISGVKATADELSKNVKNEIIKTNGMMDKMKEEVKGSCSAGGAIDTLIQQSVNQAYAFLK